ncbi:MAG TPA: SCO family protein [Pyrinomonadaceae bacterium]|nr:SCO family protein [Pyrinomonadaceae bacterium]
MNNRTMLKSGARALTGIKRTMTLILLICALAATILAPSAHAQQQKRSGNKASSQAKASKAKAEAHDDHVAYYSCPMHPSVRSKSPAKCPKCGMELRAVSQEDAAREAAAASNVAAAPREAGEAVDPQASLANLPDIELLDQNGRKIKFYSDLVKGKTVAINFIFTTCTTICPPLGATFARVQRDLGERTGRDVHFISVSVDPVTDTPERLKAWGAKFKAGPGWTFVTGEKAAVDSLLKALGASTASREDHTPTVIIGNDLQANWTRTYGLAKPSQIVKIIDEVSETPAPKEAQK